MGERTIIVDATGLLRRRYDTVSAGRKDCRGARSVPDAARRRVRYLQGVPRCLALAPGLVIALFGAACPIPIEDRACPCAEGFTCCNAVCVPDEEAVACREQDAGSPEDGGAPDAGPEVEPLEVEAHPERAWGDAEIVLSWSAPGQVELSSCEVSTDDGSPRSAVETGEGWALLTPAGRETLTVTCTSQDGATWSGKTTVQAASATFDWAFFGQGALPRGIGVDGAGLATLLISNQRNFVGANGELIGAPLGLEPLTVFEGLRVDHFHVYKDGAWAGAGSVLQQESITLPLGIVPVDADAVEGGVTLLDNGWVSISSAHGADDGAPAAGDLFVAGDANVQVEMGAFVPDAGPVGMVNTAGLFGGLDIWVARFGRSGEALWMAEAGSSLDDGVGMLRTHPAGGAVVGGFVGDASALFGTHLITAPGGTEGPWGYVALIDDDGEFTRAEIVADTRGLDAVAPFEDGSFLSAGRRPDARGVWLTRHGGTVGEVLWRREIVTVEDEVLPLGAVPIVVDGMVVDGEERVWVTGSAYGATTFFPSEKGEPGWEVESSTLEKPSVFVAVYASDGELLFARRLLTEESELTWAVAGVDEDGRSSVWVGGALRVPGPTEGLPALVVGDGSPNAVFADVTPLVQGAFLTKLSLDTPPLEAPVLNAPVLGDGSMSATWSSPHPAGRAKVLMAVGRPPAYADDVGATLVCQTFNNNACTSGALDVETAIGSYLRVFEAVGPDRWVGSQVVQVQGSN